MPTTYSLKELSEIISAEQIVNENVQSGRISGINSIENAQQGEISFIANQKYASKLSSTSASAVIVPPDLTVSSKIPLLICSNPYLAYAQISQLFDKCPIPSQGIHPTAVICETADVHHSACVGANAVISAKAKIGANTVIGSGVYIGDGVIVGTHSHIQANVSIHYACEVGDHALIQSGTVIGSDGFGYAPKKDGWEKIAQVGRVIIGNRVEIGANTCIDRGAIQDTLIADDVIIDNLVHISHNVEVRQATAIAGGVGIAGSTVVGKNCTIGGQSGINGHIEITDNVHLSGMAMVTKGIKEPGLYAAGLPLMAQRAWRKVVVHIRKLDDLAKRVKVLENEKSKD